MKQNEQQFGEFGDVDLLEQSADHAAGGHLRAHQQHQHHQRQDTAAI